MKLEGISGDNDSDDNTHVSTTQYSLYQAPDHMDQLELPALELITKPPTIVSGHPPVPFPELHFLALDPESSVAVLRAPIRVAYTTPASSRVHPPLPSSPRATAFASFHDLVPLAVTAPA